MAKTIKDKGPTGRLVNPKIIENALGAEETKVQIDARRGPISLFPLRVIRSHLCGEDREELADI